MGISDAISNAFRQAIRDEIKKASEPEEVAMPMIPFPISESTRILLHLIVNNDDPEICPPKLKAILSQWLTQYDQALHEHLVARYGEESVPYTREISRQVLVAQAKFLANMKVPKPADPDDLSDLEKHFKDD